MVNGYGPAESMGFTTTHDVPADVAGPTVPIGRAVANKRAYVLDDQAALRRHMTIFVDGHTIRDRATLSDPVSEASRIYVFQALSGG